MNNLRIITEPASPTGLVVGGVSIYNVLVNSNQSPEDLPLADFKKQVMKCLGRFNTQEYLVWNEGFQPDLNADIVIRPAFEVGTKMHRLHCHASVIITHRSSFKAINREAMKLRLPDGYLVWATLHLIESQQATRRHRYNLKQNL